MRRSEQHGRNLVVALDRARTQTYDVDGRLHVSCANISKAAVNGYLGREIPDWQSLGLNPDQTYQLFRDPNELAKAAATFNNLPLLSRHVPVDARDHQPDLVCGSTGTDARFMSPYLQNSLVIWTAAAINGVVTGTQRQLSSAYRYRAVMKAGVFECARFDGKMVDIVGNHVALVLEGRAGPDVVVGDSTISNHDFGLRFPHAARIKATA